MLQRTRQRSKYTVDGPHTSLASVPIDKPTTEDEAIALTRKDKISGKTSLDSKVPLEGRGGVFAKTW